MLLNNILSKKNNFYFWFRLLVISVFFPYVLHYIVYYGFISNYTFDVFSLGKFSNGYDNGVFRYRVLGKAVFLEIYRFISENSNLENVQHKYIHYLDSKGNMAFYKSYFLFNVFFNICTFVASFLVLSLKKKWFHLQETQVNLTALLIVFFVSITQYVVTPYDAISYFTIVLSFPLILKLISKPNTLHFIGLVILVVVSTLTRESSAIILSLYAALLFFNRNFIDNKPRHFSLLAGIVFTYLVVYFGLRFYFGFNDGFIQKGTIIMNQNFSNPKNLVGFLFLVLSVLFLLMNSVNKKNVKLYLIFLAFCLPYLMFCWFTGMFFETRLWVPVILPGFFLVNLILPISQEGNTILIGPKSWE